MNKEEQTDIAIGQVGRIINSLGLKEKGVVTSETLGPILIATAIFYLANEIHK